jgi:hypothetical protein
VFCFELDCFACSDEDTSERIPQQFLYIVDAQGVNNTSSAHGENSSCKKAVRSYKSAGQGNQKSYDIPILGPDLAIGIVATQKFEETHLTANPILKQIVAIRMVKCR